MTIVIEDSTVLRNKKFFHSLKTLEEMNQSPVNIPPMADTHNLDDQAFFENLVNNAIIPNPNAVTEL
jgi:hypothetical protein